MLAQYNIIFFVKEIIKSDFHFSFPLFAGEEIGENLFSKYTAFFRNHIFEQSSGSPRVIFELVERYCKETFVTNDIVRQVKHYGSLPEYDMSIVVMLALGSLAILRYLSIEIGDNTMKFFGGAALIGLILFRNVFRFTKQR